MSRGFQIVTLSPGLLQPAIALATQRAGGLAVLDFEYVSDHFQITEAIRRFNQAARAPYGIKVSGDAPELLARLVVDLPNQLKTIILASARPEALRDLVRILRERSVTTLLESRSLEHAKSGEVIGVDGLVAKGHEAGGRIGEETTFILLQRLREQVSLPVWAHGGIGLHTAPACAAAGAAGIVLDAQLALTRESPLPDGVKAQIASMDGGETICLGTALGEAYRIYFRPGNPVVKQLQELESRLANAIPEEGTFPETQIEWRQAVMQRAGWQSDQHALMLGQDAAFAAPLAARFRTVGGVLEGMREAVRTHCDAAISLRPLAEGAPLACSNGTRFPILQGPMTRVSDVPEFAAQVAEGGALPFLALALMRGPEVKTVLTEAHRRLGTLPWGVGILGFVPPELRQEQMDVISECPPPFALIAGGRPDHARVLEQKGIPTYLHVPSPGLLKMFVQQGARRFVFEGRECGGHVGPRTSFVLWNQMVDVLLDAPESAVNPEEFHIVFAAGIHDSLSAAMVSVIAAPLAERGMRIGVLLGTAYLFTEEAVASGAISETFQEQAQSCRHTVLLETGPGHSTRCVDTAFAASFTREKRRLSAEGRPADEIRMALEELNLGRLRIASKGVTRHPDYGQDPAAPKLLQIEKSEQLAQGMYMIGQLAALRQKTCTVEALHHDVSVEGSNRLDRRTEFREYARPVRAAGSPSDVAIIGMSCLLPKAPDLATYWENILKKVNAVGEIPKDRWNWELYFDSDPKTRDKIYSKWGGFLDDIPFDPMTYGMPPASLRSIEPAQLLTLEVVRAALADAGYWGRPFPRERTSVILGAGGGAADLGLGYGARSFIPVFENLPEFRGRSREILDRLDGYLPEWTEDSFAGILTNVSAGRVANRFDLGGSNYTVDAACASSLAAVSQALKELESQTSDMVIVGGMDTMQNPFTYLCFSKTHALSPRGRCRTFDESADGIAISEGIAIMVFKRLADAERDGDRIYAVIKGAGSSSDGKDRGLTAPRPAGQAKALRRAYAKAGISPATVGLIEAHGTGTVAGDEAEVQALTEVFSEAQAARQGCALGSVKSMIGHTKCTAGAAGLMKVALALHHKVLPPTLGVENPNPRARFPETPFFVNTEVRPWLANPSGDPRRAGVSAFGFGGTNFHIVVEEYQGDPLSSRPAPLRHWPDELFLWKADSRANLHAVLEKWIKALDTEAKPDLCDLAYTAWSQAKDAGNDCALQLAIVASSLTDLRQKLGWAVQGLAQNATSRINDPRGVYFTEHPLAAEGKLAFLFPGQGSQYPRMLEDLLLLFPEMQEIFERSVRALQGKLPEPLSAYVYPPASFSREDEQKRQAALTQTNVAQPALGAVSLAMLGLLRELGLEPDMAAGHSYGEYVALAAAGAFDADTLIKLSEARGRFIVEGGGLEPGVMAAIEADASAVAEVLKNLDGVCLANANAPKQSVISGSRAAVEQAVAQFTAQGMTARMIPVACAFHSPLVAPAQAQLSQFLSAVEVAEPGIPVYSNTTAAPYPKEPRAVAQRLVEHLVRPVEFVREIVSMYEAGARVFVEVGPRAVLTGLVDQILEGRPKIAVASNQNGRPGLTQLLHLLGQLASHGYRLKLDRLYRDRTNRLLDLNALPGECSEKQPAPSAWMVNGSRARPLQEMPGTNSPKVVPSESVERLAPRASGPTRPPAAPVMPERTQEGPKPFEATPPAVEMASPADAAGVPQVMTQFQQVMTRFLETQKSVMLNYLGSGADAPAVSSSISAPASDAVATAQDAEHSPQSKPEKSGITAAPVTSAPAQEEAVLTGPSEKQLTAQLLSIVSERTGYPPEMLDLNSDLEADFGIDSIKRVEILGTLQQSFIENGIRVEEGLMEKLTGVRTLQGIIERVMEQLGPQTSAVFAPPSPATGEQKTQVQQPPSSALEKQTLTAQLLSIVSERTGYPPEMLDLNLDLEADLGIDSIKRVEILGTLQQSFVASGIGVEEGLMEKLTGIRTLQGIIDRVFGEVKTPPTSRPAQAASETPATKPAVPDQPVPPPHETQAEIDRIRRFTLTAVETPLSSRKKTIAKDRTILITDAGHPVAPELVNQLTGQGYRVAIVRHSAGPNGGVQELDPGSYSADLSSPEAVTRLIALVSQRQGPLCGIVHLLALQGQASFAAHDYQGWKEQIQSSVKSLFLIAKEAGPQLREAGRENGATLIAATGMGGTFLTNLPTRAQAKFPDHGAVAGFIKTLAVEWPEVAVRVVDLNLEENAAGLARHLVEEWNAGDEHAEVGYEGTRRVALRPAHAPLSPEEPSMCPLDSSSVVLITGGARGITALAAKRLAQLYQPTLILAGRSALPPPEESAGTAGLTTPKELKAALMSQMRSRGQTVTPALVERAYAHLMGEREIRGNLNDLRKLGAKVSYHPVDVRDEKAFGSFIDGIYSSFGRLDGVIHGAGVIEDKLVLDKTPESFDRVFNTKVDSAFVLSRKLRPESLKFLVFFSSVSGRFGNRGQGDYAAANEVLNKVAVCLDRDWPGRVVAMNWGPWDTGGMVSAEVRKQFAERGVELISIAAGLRRLEEELHFGRRGEAEVVIGGAGWQPAGNASARRQKFPLLRQAIPFGSNGTRELIREIDPAYDLYLRDHQLDGQAVLPLAVATELIAESVAEGWPEKQVIAVRDLRLFQGVVLDGRSKTVRVLANSQTGAGPSSASVTVEVIGTGKPHRIHYRATVDLADHLPDPPSFNTPPLADGRPFHMKIPEIYDRWLFHGPLFHGITGLDLVGPSGIKATLATTSPKGWINGGPDGQWLIDPLMFDSSLQLLVLWARENWDMTALPSGFQKFRRFASPSASRIVCEMRIRPNTGGQTIHADIFFLDADTGRVVSILEDMQGACSKALNRLSDRKVLAATGRQ